LNPVDPHSLKAPEFNPRAYEAKKTVSKFIFKSNFVPLQSGGGGGVGGGAAWYQRGAAGTALASVDSWWQQVSTAAESFVAGAGVDTMLMEEDPRYLEATEYLLLLEERLKKAVRSSDDVVSAVNTMGLIVGNFGENAHILGRTAHSKLTH
jgi:sorting nexin-1/2